MTCPGRGAELERLFSGELEGPEAAALRQHVNGCPLCRAYYDRLSHVASTVENRSVPAFAVETLERRLMARLGVEDRSSPSVSVLVPPRRKMWRPVIGFAAAAAIAAVIIPWAFSDRGDSGGFTARSGGGASVPFPVKAFCIQAGKVSREAISGGQLWCPTGGAVQLVVTAAEPVSVKVTVETAGGETLEPGGDIQVPAGTDISLPVSIPSSETWLSGPAVMKVTVRGRSGQGAEHQLTIVP